MAFVTYDGSAVDHQDHPATYRKKKTGEFVTDKEGKREVVSPWRRDTFAIETYKLADYEFPKGKPVELRDKVLVAKCLSLGCFNVRLGKGEPTDAFDKALVAQCMESGKLVVDKVVDKAEEPKQKAKE